MFDTIDRHLVERSIRDRLQGENGILVVVGKPAIFIACGGRGGG